MSLVQDIIAQRRKEQVTQPEQSQQLQQPQQQSLVQNMIAQRRQGIEPVKQAEPIDLKEQVMSRLNQQMDIMDKRGEAKRLAATKGFVENFVHPVQQMGLELAEKMGIVEPGTVADWTKMKTEDRELFSRQFEQEYGTGFDTMLAEIVGAVAPAMAVPAARTLPGAMGVGAGFGAAQFIPEGSDQTRAWEAVKGAFFGGMMKIGIDRLPTVKQFIKKHVGLAGPGKNVMDELEKGLSESEIITKLNVKPDLVKRMKFIRDGNALSERTGVDFKLSQITGDTATEWMEKVARLGSKGERLARMTEVNQVVQSFKYWKNVEKQLFSPEKILQRSKDPNSYRFGFKAQSAFDRLMGKAEEGTGLLGRRATNAKKNFQLIDEIAGNKEIIPINNFTTKLQELIDENTLRGSGSSQIQVAKELAKIMDDFVEGMASGKEMQNLLQQYGRASRGSQKLFKDIDQAAEKRVATQLFKALNDDLDKAAEGSDVIAKTLRNARDQYALDTSMINQVRDSALGTLFGKKNPSLTDIEATFHKMDPTELKSAMDVLVKHEPTIHAHLQRFWLERALRKAEKRGSADAFPFIAGQMMRIMDDPAFKTVFNTAESRKLIKDGVDVARRIVLNNQTTGGMSVSRMKELSGVLASRDPTFTARLISEPLVSEMFSKAILTKEGQEILKRISTLKPNMTSKMTAALIQLEKLMNE